MHQITVFNLLMTQLILFFKLSFDFAISIIFIIMHSLWRDAVKSCEVRTPVQRYLCLEVGPSPTGNTHQVHLILLVLYHSLFWEKNESI